MSNANMPKGRGMVKWAPFAALTPQFDGIRERIENMLLCSLVSEEEIMITYYEDGYLLSSYMTVVDIAPSNSAVVCTDAFYNKMKLHFSNIIDVK